MMASISFFFFSLFIIPHLSIQDSLNHHQSSSVHNHHHFFKKRDITSSGHQQQSRSINPLLPLFGQHNSTEKRSLQKRGNSFSGRATYYATGLGACGETNTDSDFIVALNQAQYQANKWCKKSITIHYGGKSHPATIMDMCPGCPYGALDFSPALFKFFASLDAGVFYMTWDLDDGSGGGGDNGGGGGDNQQQPAKPPPPPPAPVVQPPPPVQPPPKDDDNDNSGDDQNAPAKPVKQPDPPKEDPPPPQPVNSNNPGQGFSSSPNSSTAAKAGNGSSSGVNSKSGVPFTATNTPVVLNTPQYAKPQTAKAYETGGNLDTINHLVIAFGTMTGASAQVALGSSPST